MKRLLLAAVGLALAVALGTSTTAAAQSPSPAAIFQACSVVYSGSIAVTFAWPPTPGALQQWVDLTLFDNGFQPGTFLGEGPVLGTGFTWHGIEPELLHFYRVNVLYPDGWVTVASGSFLSMGGCPKPTADPRELTDIWCNADSVDVTFMWTPADGDSQWLDLAESPRVMALDTYHAFGPLSPDTNSFRLRIPTNTSYWWRVNTHSAAGWSPSAVSSFRSAYCGPQAPPAAPPTPIPPPPIPPPPTLPPSPPTSPQTLAAYVLGGAIVADDGQFLGIVSCSPFDALSIFNRFGDYGSRFSSTSIWNRFGEYGGKFGSYSPFNIFAPPPAIYVGSLFAAYLTESSIYAPRLTPLDLILLCDEQDFLDYLP